MKPSFQSLRFDAVICGDGFRLWRKYIGNKLIFYFDNFLYNFGLFCEDFVEFLNKIVSFLNKIGAFFAMIFRSFRGRRGVDF